MPAALTLILICPSPGSVSGTPAHFSTSGGPYPVITIALGMAVPSLPSLAAASVWPCRLRFHDPAPAVGGSRVPAPAGRFLRMAYVMCHVMASGLTYVMCHVIVNGQDAGMPGPGPGQAEGGSCLPARDRAGRARARPGEGRRQSSAGRQS